MRAICPWAGHDFHNFSKSQSPELVISVLRGPFARQFSGVGTTLLICHPFPRWANPLRYCALGERMSAAIATGFAVYRHVVVFFKRLLDQFHGANQSSSTRPLRVIRYGSPQHIEVLKIEQRSPRHCTRSTNQMIVSYLSCFIVNLLVETY